MQTLDQVLGPLRGLTDKQIKPHAEAVGIPIFTVRNALTKTKNPRFDTFVKLCEVSRLVQASGIAAPVTPSEAPESLAP